MPSPIGHILAGVATALGADIAAPQPRSDPSRPALYLSSELLMCAALAAAPDLDLLYRRIHRTATHSVAAVVLVFIITAGLTGKVTRWRTATVYALAWASHLLLDWLGTDWSVPRGVELLWPFSDRWFISGVDLFRQTTTRHLWTMPVLLANALTVAQEVAIMLPVVLLLWLVRIKTAPRLAPKLSRSHHPAE
jgi:membrane-bound metal-dependent hydrolase YbcI (DUF457 family)